MQTKGSTEKKREFLENGLIFRNVNRWVQKKEKLFDLYGWPSQKTFHKTSLFIRYPRFHLCKTRTFRRLDPRPTWLEFIAPAYLQRDCITEDCAFFFFYFTSRPRVNMLVSVIRSRYTILLPHTIFSLPPSLSCNFSLPTFGGIEAKLKKKKKKKLADLSRCSARNMTTAEATMENSRRVAHL